MPTELEKKSWTIDQVTKSEFFHGKLHEWGLSEQTLLNLLGRAKLNENVGFQCHYSKLKTAEYEAHKRKIL